MKKSEDFGTNSNGSENKEYCHFCYHKGKFTDGQITMEQKIIKNIEIAKKRESQKKKQEKWQTIFFQNSKDGDRSIDKIFI